MKNALTVGQTFRTNPLAKKPGGSTVTVTKSDGKKLDYTNVKYPEKYLAKMDLTNVLKVQVGERVLYEYKNLTKKNETPNDDVITGMFID